jgi:type I restriction enzyme, S subunit
MTEALLGKFECPVEPASFCRLFRATSRGLGVLLSQHLTFIYAAGKTWEYQNQSTGIANFQTTHFLEKELVAVPGEEVLDSFASLVRPMVDRVHAAQISELSELRDTLLPRLISGQLRLLEAQAQLEHALA